MAEELQVEFCEHVESPLWILIIYMPVSLLKPFSSCSCKSLSYLFSLQALLIVFL